MSRSTYTLMHYRPFIINSQPLSINNDIPDLTICISVVVGMSYKYFIKHKPLPGNNDATVCNKFALRLHGALHCSAHESQQVAARPRSAWLHCASTTVSA